MPLPHLQLLARDPVRPHRSSAEADALFHRIVGYGGELGLLAEEYDPVNERLAGNYPQAFSHLGLVQAADALRKAGVRCTLPR